MDHDAVCDCHFRGHCDTFNDPLIDDARKGPTGLGCRQQSDVYRGRHCRPFACAYLSMVLTDALKQPLPDSTGGETPTR
ncbi:MAG: hypothetical protein WBF17_00610 [Phycisphaerae bacterium]